MGKEFLSVLFEGDEAWDVEEDEFEDEELDKLDDDEEEDEEEVS